MKKSISAVMVFILVCLIVTPVTASGINPDVMIDGEYINFTEDTGRPYVDKNGRTMVPVRITTESIGAVVTWEPDLQVAIIEKGEETVIVPLGKNYIYHGGIKISNDAEATTKDNRMFLPIRVVMEAFGYDVGWEQATYTVLLLSQDYKNNNNNNGSDNNTTPEEPVDNNNEGFPKIYDARDLNKITSIKNQGEIGTCWAFAALGALEAAMMPEHNYDFSEDHISLNHGYDLSQDAGGDYKIALSYLTSWKGPIMEELDPYGDGKTVDAKAVVHLQEARILPDKNIEAVKKAVMEYGAVHSSVYSPILAGDYQSIYYNETTSSLYNFDKNVPNHDVIIVGWDDNYKAENFTVMPPGDGAFLVKNSWGNDFGVDGYYYVSYYDMKIATDNVIYTRVDSNNNYNNIYQYDEFGWTRALGYTTDTAYFANVFTAKASEALKAVSFYATGPNTSYEVYIVENYTGIDSLPNMTYVTKGKFEYAGYYTVDLPKDVLLEQGKKFGVVVKITTPGERYPVAIEMNDENSWVSKAIVNEGESFISYNGQAWQDTSVSENANVCLKAFTNNR